MLQEQWSWCFIDLLGDVVAVARVYGVRSKLDIWRVINGISFAAQTWRTPPVPFIRAPVDLDLCLQRSFSAADFLHQLLYLTCKKNLQLPHSSAFYMAEFTDRYSPLSTTFDVGYFLRLT